MAHMTDELYIGGQSTQKLSAVIPISAELLADVSLGLMDQLYNRTPKQWQAAQAERDARLGEEFTQAVDRHATLLGRLTGPLYPVADLHGPHRGSLGVECRGCECGGYDAEPPEWPCETWALIESETS